MTWVALCRCKLLLCVREAERLMYASDVLTMVRNLMNQFFLFSASSWPCIHIHNHATLQFWNKEATRSTMFGDFSVCTEWPFTNELLLIWKSNVTRWKYAQRQSWCVGGYCKLVTKSFGSLLFRCLHPWATVCMCMQDRLQAALESKKHNIVLQVRKRG